jgi:hypothetical protein
MILVKPQDSLEEKVKDSFQPYQSEEHKTIADALTQYGIPFTYKQPTLVIENGQRTIEYADFFLPSYRGLAIDYIIESNSAIYRRKKNVYQDNQIPAVLISRRDIARPGFGSALYKALESSYRPKSHYKKRGKYG